MLAPGSMGGRLSKSVSQTFFAFLAGCEEEEISKTTAQTGLPLRFVTVQVGRLSAAGWISTRNSGRSAGSLWKERRWEKHCDVQGAECGSEYLHRSLHGYT